MALTKEDLQAIQQLLQPIYDEQATIRTEMAEGFEDTRNEQAAIRAEMAEGFKNTRNEQAAIRAEMAEGFENTRNEQAAIRTEMAEGFENTRNEQTAIRAETAENFERVHGDIANLYQNYDKQMKLLNENLPNAVARHEAVAALEAQVENHANRISALEQKAANG